ncbi:DUF4861 domain-containing protein [Aquimarina sp. MMG015]|uniref:DUF4861 domain-containing protein n=1 Tax=Aquimarina sp. MMG015 TaxID=2822689 RepID=UPI001B3A5230|nr:DUF4861 domain-containing protein [Aquimarina sp. MMG015]MBQ4805801.1 DUF4861 domain-containing protein [Aquimarina sp. MMG015]
MKHLCIIISLTLTVISCKKESVSDQGKKYISFTNTSSIDRMDESIIIPKDIIINKLDSISDNRVPIIKDSSGRIIPFQLDNLEKKEEWDELSLTLDFKANQTQKLELTTIATESIPSFTPRTNIRFGIGTNKNTVKEVLEQKRTGDPRTNDSIFYQMEGPAWENDKVGFRFYFDPRNGIDIFGKNTSELVLDRVGLGEGNYHELDDWGMDVLKVGNSLGAGALAIKYNDSLIRLTGKDQAEFKTVMEGPIRSVFDMIYRNSKIGDQNIDVVHRITIWKGQWGYQSQVFFRGATNQMDLVTGIVNLKPNDKYSKSSKKHFILETFGAQSENNDFLGMAIIVPEKDFINEGQAPKENTDITTTYYTVMNASDKKPTIFYFLAGWEQSNAQFNTYEGFDKIVSEMSEKLSNPILIK